MASHGGFLEIFIASFLLLRRLKRINFLELVDRVVVPTALVAGFIRFGNLFNSEMVGHQTDLPWAVVFPKLDRLPHHPTQVYEALGYVACFVALFSPIGARLRKPASA